MATLRLGDPLDKNTDIGAINSAEQLARIRELSDAGEAEGAQRWSPPCELPERGFWFPPTIFTGVSASHRIAREEIFGPVLSVLTFRTPQEAVDKANNTPYGLSAGIWTEKGSRILWMARAAARRRRLGQHVQPLRPGLAVRRLQGVRLRARGRPARAGGLPCPLSALRGPRLRVRKTYKLAIGGAFPRSESGRSYPVEDASGRAARACRTGLAQGRARRCRGGAQGVPGLVGRHAYNRGQVIYRVAEMLDGRREQFAAEVAAAEGVRPTRRCTASASRSTASSGTPAGPTSSPRSRARPTRSPGRTSTSRCPSRPAWSPSWRRRSRACSASSACSRRCSAPATRR